MQVLAFDTSTETLSVALSFRDHTWCWDGEGGAQASVRLIPQILQMLGEAGCALADVDAIAFGQGPGAFTGLRTACSVAQGLAFAAGKPVLALDSLMIVAQATLGTLLSGTTLQDLRTLSKLNQVWVAMDARMGEIYAACYSAQPTAQQGMQWQTMSAPALYTPAALHEQWKTLSPSCVVGSALQVPALTAVLTHQPSWLPDEPASRAAALIPLAQSLWNEGGALDAAQALPTYVRNKVALTVAERQAPRASAG
jgi:tRNA threonylcarbamoyladenosine biosynthesis protein TsaB